MIPAPITPPPRLIAQQTCQEIHCNHRWALVLPVRERKEMPTKNRDKKRKRHQHDGEPYLALEKANALMIPPPIVRIEECRIPPVLVLDEFSALLLDGIDTGIVTGREAAVTAGEAHLEGKRLGQRLFQREVDDGQIRRLGTGELKRELHSAAVGHASLLEMKSTSQLTTQKACLIQ